MTEIQINCNTLSLKNKKNKKTENEFLKCENFRNY